jgi:hypothetical protein
MLPASAPPAIATIAQRFAETSRGVVGYRLHRTFEARAGFSSRHEDLVMNAIVVDGSIAKVHVLSYTIDGKPASAAAASDVEHSWENPKPGDVFAPPFDSRNFGAYQYQSSAPGTIGFTSTVHDAGHGNGSFTYDAQGDVLACVYQPNALPPHATSGEVSDRRAEVLPGYWAVTQETQNYRGRVGPFPGTGTVQFDYSDFHRYADLSAALREL